MTSAQRAAGRALLAAVGLGLIAYLVRSAGPRRVAETLWRAGAWLPLIIVLELMQIAGDYVSLRVLLGKGGREVPPGTWVRSSALAYGLMIVLPAGRAAGEVARASLIAKHTGATRAAGASARLQAAYVFAIAILSAIESVSVATRFGVRTRLALLLAGNAVIMTAIAGSLMAILWDARLGRWLYRIRRRLIGSAEQAPPHEDGPPPRTLPWRACAICLVARSAQALQYGIMLYAVGGAFSIHGALTAHGIELVGATAGDLFPNQVGVVDGAYRMFAADVGFADAPARALSIALLSRVARLLVAASCFVVVALSRRATPASSPPPHARPAGPRGEHTGRVPLS